MMEHKSSSKFKDQSPSPYNGYSSETSPIMQEKTSYNPFGILCIIKLAAIERWPDSLLDTQGGCNREVAVIER